MITKAKIVKDINKIRDDTSVKFKNFGGFLLKLMLLPVEDQKFVVDSLMKASKRAIPIANIVIHSIRRSDNNSFPFILEHEFRCKLCKQIHKEEINMSTNMFKDGCEMCIDKARDMNYD